jgi:hypothetical protein
VAPPPSWEEQFDADHDDEVPVRYRMVEDVLGEPGSNPGLASRTLSEDLLLAEDVEPSTYEQAQAHECWRLAMLDELTSIEANGTWELVDPPQMQRPIGLGIQDQEGCQWSDHQTQGPISGQRLCSEAGSGF